MTISNEAVEKATDALGRQTRPGTWSAKESIRAALEAAAPIIRAEAAEQWADALDETPYEDLECNAEINNWRDALNVNRGIQAGTRFLLSRAVAERGKS